MNSETTTTCTSPTKDIVLSADERYDVWQVKREERPILLTYEQETNNTSHRKCYDDEDGEHKDDNYQRMPLHQQDGLVEDSKNYTILRAGPGNRDDDIEVENEEEPLPLPLIDGCDILGWRRYKLVR